MEYSCFQFPSPIISMKPEDGRVAWARRDTGPLPCHRIRVPVARTGGNLEVHLHQPLYFIDLNGSSERGSDLPKVTQQDGHSVRTRTQFSIPQVQYFFCDAIMVLSNMKQRSRGSGASGTLDPDSIFCGRAWSGGGGVASG